MKKLFSLLALLLILLVGAVLVLHLFLGRMVKAGVEAFGPQLTQTSVSVESVSLSPVMGTGKISGLVVGNPEGFASEKAFSVQNVAIELRVSTLFSDHIVIDRLIITGADFVYEAKLSGSNIGRILDNVKKATETTQKDKPKDPESERSVEIVQLVVDQSTLQVVIAGKPVAVSVGRVEMNNIGGAGDEKNIAETVEWVLTEVLRAVLEQAQGRSGSITERIKGMFGS